MPLGFPVEWPSWMEPLLPNEAVDPGLLVLAGIEDPELRAQALLASGVQETCSRSRQLILSVAQGGGWAGSIAQGLLRPTAEEAALEDLLRANREYFRKEGRRVRRSLERNAPWYVRELRNRRAPWLVRDDAFAPSLLDVLEEIEGANTAGEKVAE